MTTEEDIAGVAGQLAELTHVVEEMAKDLKAMTERADARADSQQKLAQLQQERIDRTAKELAEVGDRLHAAAMALREST